MGDRSEAVGAPPDGRSALRKPDLNLSSSALRKPDLNLSSSALRKPDLNLSSSALRKPDLILSWFTIVLATVAASMSA